MWILTIEMSEEGGDSDSDTSEEGGILTIKMRGM